MTLSEQNDEGCFASRNRPPDGGIHLGERSLLFHLNHSMRTLANIGAASRDGSRILALATDSVEETLVQVLTDWTTLVKL